MRIESSCKLAFACSKSLLCVTHFGVTDFTGSAEPGPPVSSFVPNKRSLSFCLFLSLSVSPSLSLSERDRERAIKEV